MHRNITLIVYVFVLLTSAFHLGCRTETTNECRDFYSMPSYEASHAFRDDYPIEKQLNIYRCGMQRHPPDFGLAVYIAERGEKNISVILDRFKAEKDEPTKVGMLFIVELMSQKGYFRGRQDLIEQLKQVVSSMSKVGQDQAKERLDNIIKNSLG